MNKPTKLFLWSSTCFMTWLSTGCQPSKALTASQPVPSLIPAVELPAQASSTNPEPQGVAPAPSATASAPDTPVELDLGSVRASALKNNLNIQVELLSIDSAQATLEEARRSPTPPCRPPSIEAATTAPPPKTPKVRKMTTAPPHWVSPCRWAPGTAWTSAFLGSALPPTLRSVCRRTTPPNWT